jgi:DNA-binding NarL/FixJ family response regulator
MTLGLFRSANSAMARTILPQKTVMGYKEHMKTNDPHPPSRYTDKLYPSFKVFHELMAWKVQNILLVSSPYDAFIMEEDGRLAGRIIDEYRGLNLSRPPRLSWVSTAQEALSALSHTPYDIVITMPRLDDMPPHELGRKIKSSFPNLPVFLLTHAISPAFGRPDLPVQDAFDKVYVWSGNTDLLLALIKNVEDRMNVEFDTQHALVRVILLMEDSPVHASAIIPMLYKEIVTQTQRVMEESINEEHRLLRMRARTKILIAETYEEAEKLYRQFTPYLLCVISDVGFSKNGRMDDTAGVSLLSMIRKENPDIPLLTLSSEEDNRQKVAPFSTTFINKNASTLHTDIHKFFISHLGFGDFIFRLPTGKTVGHAENLRSMEKVLPGIPDEALYYHAARNDFSVWLMARAEVQLASELRPVKASDFNSAGELRDYLISCIRNRREGQQKGHITDFIDEDFDPKNEFIKIGKGSLGGKARSLAFLSTLLRENPKLHDAFPDIDIRIPKTIAITTDGFDAFINDNLLDELPFDSLSDAEIQTKFMAASFPDELEKKLDISLRQVTYPLAVRSSSLLEDAQYHPFAGIYQTYMIPNDHTDINIRMNQLITAIKRVYASTYLSAPRAYSGSTSHRIEDEKMGIIVQEICGARYGEFYYPAMSGVVQSYNYYPISHLTPEDGVAHIALGLGKTVVEGETALRFSPKYPQFLPGYSSVEEILNNSQKQFYALKMSESPQNDHNIEDIELVKLDIDEVADHPPVRFLSSTYIPSEHRIRDVGQSSGHPVLTFASILKYNSIPLPQLLLEILTLGRKGMGSPVEIEFAVNFSGEPFSRGPNRAEFSLLQIRPMAVDCSQTDVVIHPEEIKNAFCYSTMALGNGCFRDIHHILYVKPETFNPADTIRIAADISRFNQLMRQANQKYILIGPGRWGSADRWLGIPVKWHDISQVSAILETASENLQATPSQGSHFFHNITSMGISYITVRQNKTDFIDRQWINNLPAENETAHIKLVRGLSAFTIKINGKTSSAVFMK